MSGAEIATLRPRVEELRTLSQEQGASLASLERRIEEGIATYDKGKVQLLNLAIEVGAMVHQLNSLKCAIGVVLDDLDRLAPLPAPPQPRTKSGKHPIVTTSPKKGGNS